MIMKNFLLPIKYFKNFILGRLEPELKLIVPVRSKSLCIDVGANRGIYSYKFIKAGYVVHAFEPNPSEAAWIRHWAKNYDRLKLHLVALSDKAANGFLAVPHSDGREVGALGRIVSSSEEQRCIKNEKIIPVESKTLDSFGFDNISYIKIDVEGHEYSVILGALETIKNCRPIVIVEIERRHLLHRSVDDVVSLILSLGYDCSFISDNILYPYSEFRLDLHQASTIDVNSKGYINNFVFTPYDLSISRFWFHSLRDFISELRILKSRRVT